MPFSGSAFIERSFLYIVIIIITLQQKFVKASTTKNTYMYTQSVGQVLLLQYK